MGPAPFKRVALKSSEKSACERRSSPPVRSDYRLVLDISIGCPVASLVAIVLFALLSVPGPSSASTLSSTAVILVVGAPGEAEYGSNFVRQAELWQQACVEAQVCNKTIGLDPPGSTNDYDALRQVLTDAPKESDEPLWLVLIGHGTFDGKEAWFNLRGPDVSAGELSNWLKSFRRPLAVINTAACSGPFLT
jgi:hypothetical protein